MKGDFTRLTFDRTRRFSSVRMQQGRVQLDADWNEQVDIDRYLRETALADVIGRCGAPLDENGGGFRVSVTGDGDLAISRGRIYVDGILCENLAPEVHSADEEIDEDGNFVTGAESLLFSDQPDLPLPPDGSLIDLLAPGDGDPIAAQYLVYLDVWHRHLTALEVPAIREVALGGPDTATRTRTVCQVRAVPAGNDAACDAEVAAYDDATAPPSGCLRARARPSDDLDSPCVVPAAAGYTRLENQLYRVEVHRGGELGGIGPAPTFKWSRDNGSVVTEWIATDGNEVEVASLGRDDVLGFQPGEWVELTDDGRELRGEPGQLRRISGFGDGTLILDAAPGDPDPVQLSKVRRWNMSAAAGDLVEGAVAIAAAPDDDSWIALEGGIQIDFAPGTYRTGDYWVIPARAFLGVHAGAIEWPQAGGGPAFRSPHGIVHHYCRLAIVSFDGELFTGTATDCRPTFCPLTDPCGEGDGCCCCTVTVGDGVVSQGDENTLAAGWQRALQEADEGQWIEICLLEGTHRPQGTLTIDRDRVVIRGCGAGSVIEAPAAFAPAGEPAQGPVFRVTGSDVTFESFAVTGGADVPLIESTGDRFAVRHCRLGNRTGPLLVALAGTGMHFADNLCEVGITYGVEFGGSDVRVERNRFDSFGGGLATDTRGALHLAPGARFVAVLDNDLLNAGGHAITLGGLLPQIVRAPDLGPFSRLGSFVAAAVARRSPFLREVVISRNRIRSAAGSGLTSRWISTEPVPPAGIDADGDGQIDLLGIAEEAVTAQIPARIEGLIVSDNSISGCVRDGAALGRRDDGAPYGGVVLGHVERATVTGNTIDGNGNRQRGISAARPAVPVVGIFVQDGLEVEVAGNLVVDNGLDREDAARHAGAEGGIVLLETGVALEPGGVTAVGADGTVGLSRRPDGPSAARVAGNRVESVRGLALQLGGSGPMQVDGNQLSRLRRAGDPMGGAVLVVNSGIAPILGGLYRVLGASGLASADQVDDVLTSEPYETGGPVRFSGNQVRFDARQTFEAAAVIVFSLDDISFQDNRLDSRPADTGLRMLADAFLFGLTTRASGNGLSETLGSAVLSLWSYGFFQSTGTANQGTHCILIERGLLGQKVDAHNLSLCCAFPDLRILEVGDPQEFPCRPPRRNDLFLANAEFSAAFGGGA